MEYELRHPARKLWVAVALLVLTAAYLALITARHVAAYLASGTAELNLVRAARLDRGNADYSNRLGRVELSVDQSPQTALPWLEKATRLNPYRADYWIDLALARQSIGEFELEKQDLRRALAAAPRTPDIAWQAANLFLAQGSTDDAMQGFRLVMENDPSLAPLAIQTCWKIRPDIEFLLDRVVPPEVDESFWSFLVAKDEWTAAARVWEKMYSLQQPVTRPHLFEYLQHLVAHQQPTEAAMVWQQAAGLAGLAAYQPSSENLLVNSDFSLEILNGGFDWLHQKIRGVSLALDPNETHSSSRSLRIVFDGPGIGDAGIRQIVTVEPNTRYEFSGFYKAQEMDGAGGAEFMIQDLYRETPLFTSEDLRDADFWKKASGSFITGPETRLVMLRIARMPAGSPIRGKLWIDGLKLAPRNADLTPAGKETP